MGKAEFDSFAGDYDELLKDPLRDGFAPDPFFFHQRKWDVIRQFYRETGLDTRTLDWIDVGCGRGELLGLGQPFFRHVTGCDVSKGMLDTARSFEVMVQTDVARLPFEDASCDFVTAVCVFHHVEAPHQPSLIVEMKRILHQGGIACIIEHNPFNPITKMIVRRTPVDANAVLLRPPRTGHLFRQASLSVIKTVNFLYFPAAIYARLHRVEQALRGVPLGGQYAVFARK